MCDDYSESHVGELSNNWLIILESWLGGCPPRYDQKIGINIYKQKIFNQMFFFC